MSPKYDDSAGVPTTPANTTVRPSTSQAGRRSDTGAVHAARNRCGGSRNRISTNDAGPTNVDSPVWAPSVAAAPAKSASVP